MPVVLIETDTLHHRIIVGEKARGRLGRAPGEFHYPSRTLVIRDHAYVCDSWNHRVQVFELPDWKFAFEFGDFFCPKWTEVIEDSTGPLLIVVDTNNARLCFHETDGRRIGTYEFESQSFPVSARRLNDEMIEVVFEDDHVETLTIACNIRPADWTTRLESPISIVRDSKGFFYVSDFARRTVDKFDMHGKFIAEIVGPPVLTLPGKMALNGDDLLITDRPANAVFIYNTIDQKYRKWDYAFDGPGYIARDPRGHIWVGPYTCEPNPAGAAFPVFTPRYEFLRTVAFRETCQPTCIAFADGNVLIGDQHVRNVFVFSEDGRFINNLREQPYDSPVWSVLPDSAGHLYVGVGPVVDLHWSSELNRLYYIDIETSSVRYSGGNFTGRFSVQRFSSRKD
jgi:NHL repeat